MTTPNDPQGSPQREPGHDPWTGTESLNTIYVEVDDSNADRTVRPRRPEIPLEYPRPQRPKKQPPEQPRQSDNG
jgi:hypothetical protein